MSIDTGAKFRDALVGMFAPDMNTNAIAIVDGFLNQEFRYTTSHPLNTAAATALTLTLDQSTLVPMRAKTFKVVVHADVVSDNTSYAVLKLVYNNGNGGSDTVLATANTTNTGAAGNPTNTITALIAYSFAIASSAVIPAGSQVQVKVTKVSSGYALPVSTYELKAVAV